MASCSPMTLPALARRSILIGELSIAVDVPESSDSVLEHSLSGKSENPYWGVLWGAAVPMARYILGRRWPTVDKSLELGCGVGLTGIAAWHAGVPVLMTDIVPEAIELVRHNAALNGLEACTAEVLDWNQPSQASYSLIFACDVLYERNQHVGLLKFLKSVSRRDTEIHIGDPGRQTSQAFLRDAAATGFQVEVLNEDGMFIEKFEAQQFRVFVLRPIAVA